MFLDSKSIEIEKVASEVFNVAKGLFSFAEDAQLQRESEQTLKSRLPRNIAYQLGKVEERYKKALPIYDAVLSNHVGQILSEKSNSTPTNKVNVDCINCGSETDTTIVWNGYSYQQINQSPICLDCWRLNHLTKNLKFLAMTQKAIDKGVEQVEEKATNWLSNQLQL